MPIYLDEVPDNVDGISRPVTLRWVIFLVVIMLTGVVLTLWQWTGERRGVSFWFTALGLPFAYGAFWLSFVISGTGLSSRVKPAGTTNVMTL